MKKDRQVEVLARIEGFTRDYENDRWYSLNGAFGRASPPQYLSDHNAIQRIINSFRKEDGDNYHHELIAIVIRDGGQYSWIDIHKASCEQKAEAILKCKSSWEMG